MLTHDQMDAAHARLLDANEKYHFGVSVADWPRNADGSRVPRALMNNDQMLAAAQIVHEINRQLARRIALRGRVGR